MKIYVTGNILVGLVQTHARKRFAIEQEVVSPCTSMLFHEKSKPNMISLENRGELVYMQSLKYTKIDKNQQSRAERHKNFNQTESKL